MHVMQLFLYSNHIGRHWRYDEKVPEYYVILEEKNTQKLAEVEREREETEKDVTWIIFFGLLNQALNP